MLKGFLYSSDKLFVRIATTHRDEYHFLSYLRVTGAVFHVFHVLKFFRYVLFYIGLGKVDPISCIRLSDLINKTCQLW